MNPKCQQAVTAAAQAIGRAIPTAAQLKKIEDSLSSKMRQLAVQRGAAWRGMTQAQRMQEAAAALMADIDAAAQRKVDNAARQVIAAANTEDRLAAIQGVNQAAKGRLTTIDGTRAEALSKDYTNTGTLVAAEKKIALGSMLDMLEAAGEKKGTGLGRRFLMTAFDAENPAMTADVVREIYGNAGGATRQRGGQGRGPGLAGHDRAAARALQRRRGRRRAPGLRLRPAAARHLGDPQGRAATAGCWAPCSSWTARATCARTAVAWTTAS
jgi:hypothetical protein